MHTLRRFVGSVIKYVFRFYTRNRAWNDNHGGSIFNMGDLIWAIQHAFATNVHIHWPGHARSINVNVAKGDNYVWMGNFIYGWQ